MLAVDIGRRILVRILRAICITHIDVRRMHTRRTARPHGHRAGISARVERFSEPALLLLLRDQPSHGYELIDSLAELIPGRRVDMGNLYRTLRGLEARGLVSSEWDAEAPGPAKRRYELTDPGRELLGEWATALERMRDLINGFLKQFDKGRR
jgi:poly-beta-hydroxybutyrate-responsive repressor